MAAAFQYAASALHLPSGAQRHFSAGGLLALRWRLSAFYCRALNARTSALVSALVLLLYRTGSGSLFPPPLAWTHSSLLPFADCLIVAISVGGLPYSCRLQLYRHICYGGHSAQVAFTKELPCP